MTERCFFKLPRAREAPRPSACAGQHSLAAPRRWLSRVWAIHAWPGSLLVGCVCGAGLPAHCARSFHHSCRILNPHQLPFSVFSLSSAPWLHAPAPSASRASIRPGRPGYHCGEQCARPGAAARAGAEGLVAVCETASRRAGALRGAALLPARLGPRPREDEGEPCASRRAKWPRWPRRPGSHESA